MNRKNFLLFLLTTVFGCAGLKLPGPLTVGEHDWPSFGKSQDRIGATADLVPPPLILAWEQDISSGMGSGSPLVIDSTVIVTNLRGELYGFNANTGKRIGWVGLGDAISGSPAIDRNIAYIAISNSRESLIAFDLIEGKAQWKKEYGDLEITPLLLNDMLYFGNTAGYFFCVAKGTGDLEWKFRLPENKQRKGIRSSAITGGGLVFFGAEDGTMYALDAKNGSEQWSYRTGAPVFAAPAIRNGTVFCGNGNGLFFALDSNTGKLLWQYNAGASIYATPSFANNTVLIGTTGGKLYALDSSTGSMLWTKEFEGVINSTAAISGSVAYVGTLKRELYAINIDDGKVLWQTTLEGRIKTSPAIASGKVFVATDDKSILAFKPVTP